MSKRCPEDAHDFKIEERSSEPPWRNWLRCTRCDVRLNVGYKLRLDLPSREAFHDDAMVGEGESDDRRP